MEPFLDPNLLLFLIVISPYIDDRYLSLKSINGARETVPTQVMSQNNALHTSTYGVSSRLAVVGESMQRIFT
ncbi:MAG: hypothetical protein KME52_11120 [Desmonostoc geniculatum HA4340-LM1]|nr:hypothetical protein [Desmonostoc geniculatum HA4340-LM1]